MSYNKKERKLADKKQRNGRFKKRLLIIFLTAVIILAVVVAGYFLIPYFSNQSTDPAGKTDTSRADYIQKVSEDAKKLTLDNDSAGAVSVYKNAIDATENVDAKQALLLMEATAYSNGGDNDNALISALASESLKNSSDTEQYIASLYEKKADNANAIIFYKKAIDNINKQDPLADSDINYYQNKIEILGGY